MLVMLPKAIRHMDAEDIERYSMGDISEERCAQFEEHLLICETCRIRVAESDRVYPLCAKGRQTDPARRYDAAPFGLARMASLRGRRSADRGRGRVQLAAWQCTARIRGEPDRHEGRRDDGQSAGGRSAGVESRSDRPAARCVLPPRDGGRPWQDGVAWVVSGRSSACETGGSRFRARFLDWWRAAPRI